MARSNPDVTQIAADLVERASYVSDRKNEYAAAQYIIDFLTTSTSLKVEVQRIADGRVNVSAKSPIDGGTAPGLLLAGHIDTVEPRQSVDRNQFQGIIENGRLYGLGSLDMKGGLAAMLAAIATFDEPPPGLQLLFYCDEEYDFLGMTHFLSTYVGLPPAACIIAEPTDLKIQRSHRGLIELRVVIRGRTGHASDPANGLNAIDGLYTAVSRLREQLARYSSETLGLPTLNLAYLRGGLATSADEIPTLGSNGNNIPDWAEAIIEIRPTSASCDAKGVCGLLEGNLNRLGLQLLQVETRHDLGALEVPEEELGFLEKAVAAAELQPSYLNAKSRGYGDGELVRRQWNIPVAYFGASGDGMHASNEYVDIRSLHALERVMRELMVALWHQPPAPRPK